MTGFKILGSKFKDCARLSGFKIPDSKFKDCARSMRIYANKKLGHSVPQCITVFHSVIRSAKTMELRPPDARCQMPVAAIHSSNKIRGSMVRR